MMNETITKGLTKHQLKTVYGKIRTVDQNKLDKMSRLKLFPAVQKLGWAKIWELLKDE